MTYKTTVYEASGVVKASPGVLYRITGYNSKASAQFIQLFDSATVPAEGAIPAIILRVEATANFSWPPNDENKAADWYFNSGISWSNSSTGPIKTIGSADVWVNAIFR